MPRQEDLRGDVLRAREAPKNAVERGLSPWNPDLARALYHLLARGEASSATLAAELARLEESYPEAVYTELLYLLCHLRFSPHEAAAHWRELTAHRENLERRLGSAVDLRVAVADYFIQVSRRLENPTFIEMRLLAETQALAYHDELTGLRNFRFFNESLAQEVARAHQYHAPLSLLMLDIDDFKAYNDRHGHQAGNSALATIGGMLGEVTRIVDVPARYGGEEFAVIMPSTPKKGAGLLAERIREQVARHRFAPAGGRLTVSIGVATCPADGDRAADLLRRADEALYQAKEDGKDRIQLWGRDRRSHLRSRVALSGVIRLAATAAQLTTLDVSEAGLRFVTNCRPEPRSLIDLELELPPPHPKVRLAARVVEVKPREGDQEAEVSARVVEMGSHDLDHLAAYLKQVGSAPAG